MKSCGTRILAIFLMLSLSEFLMPLSLCAQQPATPQPPAQQTGNENKNAQPSSSTTDQNQDLQQQEDKASQEMINGTPENGKQLPESPDMQASQASQTQGQVPRLPSETTGTAAAQALRPSGNLASRPSGAAIAPARQRRVRSFLIKLGVVAGAGVALGTVFALSHASPSIPPGAH
jgi:hypothetical protein